MIVETVDLGCNKNKNKCYCICVCLERTLPLVTREIRLQFIEINHKYHTTMTHPYQLWIDAMYATTVILAHWTPMLWKELEHRKLGWKELTLIYDLDKSLSKEMWCKMANTRKKWNTYIKRWKMHVVWGKSFLCPWTRKWFPLIMNGILEMSWFVHIFLQN